MRRGSVNPHTNIAAARKQMKPRSPGGHGDECLITVTPFTALQPVVTAPASPAWSAVIDRPDGARNIIV